MAGAPADPVVVRPVLLDSQHHQFLLVPAGGSRSLWCPPSFEALPGESYRSAVVRCLRHDRGLPTLDITPVVGLIRPGPDLPPVQYIVLVREASPPWPDNMPGLLGPLARWWTLQELKAGSVDVEPGELPILLEGYWDGWIPDGEITLE
ncbi:hypothetical protein ACIQWA_17040 [Kitasatospora sp. NPDC098652]|uniref:hypothetical protein n=1 Tax=Kitasatospora sp. NPDC098652 TaxID=3364095 RepID=UPI0038292D33